MRNEEMKHQGNVDFNCNYQTELYRIGQCSKYVIYLQFITSRFFEELS